MSKYKKLKTEHLINEMVSLCLEVPPEIAQPMRFRKKVQEMLHQRVKANDTNLPDFSTYDHRKRIQGTQRNR
jgi:hypothetical protein